MLRRKQKQICVRKSHLLLKVCSGWSCFPSVRAVKPEQNQTLALMNMHKFEGELSFSINSLNKEIIWPPAVCESWPCSLICKREWKASKTLNFEPFPLLRNYSEEDKHLSCEKWKWNLSSGVNPVLQPLCQSVFVTRFLNNFEGWGRALMGISGSSFCCFIPMNCCFLCCRIAKES